MKPNGPAIKGGCVTRRKHRAESWYFSREIVPVQGGYGTRFCPPGTNFIEHYECLGLGLLSGWEIVPVQNVVNEYWRDRGMNIANLSW